MILNVCCVWTGDKFEEFYVERLRNMVEKNLTVTHKFYCYTDNPEKVRAMGIEPIDISSYNLKGWWSKMPLYDRKIRPAGRMLYLDLDTIILGNIDKLANYDGHFCVLRDFAWYGAIHYHRGFAGEPLIPFHSLHINPYHGYGSAVMNMSEEFGDEVWDLFNSNQQHYIDLHTGQYKGGDQAFLKRAYPNADIIQEVFGMNYARSVKRPINMLNGVRGECNILCFHGKPSVLEASTKYEWINKYWK